MRFGIDATALPPRLFGAGNYIVNLVRELARIDSTHRLVIFLKPEHASLFEQRKDLQIVPVRLPSRLLRIVWEQTGLAWLARAHRLDLLHSPHYTMPLLATCTSVVTCHDMTFFIYPQLHQTYKRLFFRAMIRLSARRADALIADSESTRQDMVRVLGASPARITAIPLGVGSDMKPIHDKSAIDSIRNRYRLPSQFVLYVGVLEPRKNLCTLIQAYALAVARGLTHSLVVVGRKGWMYQQLGQNVETLGLSGRVLFTGYVPEEDLPLLYNAADIFVYPSLYEGFGLPVLEAMACGVPVVTSNVSSMPEVVGNAGILVRPRCAEDVAQALWRVVTDRDLHADLARKGIERASLFPWERTARESLAVYERIAISAR